LLCGFNVPFKELADCTQTAEWRNELY